MSPLSTTMLACKAFMEQNGGKIVRFPGGFWAHANSTAYRSRSYGTTTVNALVLRGVAEYTKYRQGRNGRFPIEATLARDEDARQCDTR